MRAGGGLRYHPTMSNQQWVHLIIIVIVASMSVIGWAVRRLKEYQAQQQMKVDQQRRREHALRTGRAEPDDPGSLAAGGPIAAGFPPSAGGGSIHDEARRRLQELAQKRKAELEAMARRAAAGQRPAAPARQKQAPARPAGAPRPSPAPAGAGGRLSESTVADARRRAAMEARSEQQHRQAAAEDAEARAEAKARAARQAKQREEASAEEKTAIGSLAAIETPARRAGLAGLGAIGAGRSATGVPSVEQWRRAIVMMEVLGPPPGLRGPGEEPGLARTF